MTTIASGDNSPMDWFAGVIAAVFGLLVVVLVAPAHVRINIDTTRLKFNVGVRPLWGMLPSIALTPSKPKAGKPGLGTIFSVLKDAPRIANALLAPGLFQQTNAFMKDVRRVGRVRSFDLDAKLGLGPWTEKVLLVARPALMMMAPKLVIEGKLIPGVDLIGDLRVQASPLRLIAVWRRFQSGTAVREFRRRLAK